MPRVTLQPVVILESLFGVMWHRDQEPIPTDQTRLLAKRRRLRVSVRVGHLRCRDQVLSNHSGTRARYSIYIYIYQSDDIYTLYNNNTHYIASFARRRLPVICSQPEQPGHCPDDHNDNSLRYYYEKVTAKCLLFHYAGCNGNMNNFRTLQECQATCSTFRKSL